jgi:hypothetical protein
MHIQPAIRYLNVTSSGRRWIATLYSNVFRAERSICRGCSIITSAHRFQMLRPVAYARQRQSSGGPS